MSADGTVRDVKVAKTSGSDGLDEAAVACVAKWHYRPALKDGQLIDAPMTGQGGVEPRRPGFAKSRRYGQEVGRKQKGPVFPPGLFELVLGGRPTRLRCCAASAR
ncbi:MAG: energy transducer TonB [Rhizomicrobium sp.]